MAVMMRVATLGGTVDASDVIAAADTPALADTGGDDSATRFALGAALSSVIVGLMVLMSARRRTS